MTDNNKISNPVVTKLYTNGVTAPGVIAEEALELLDLKAQKTPWGWDGGRPILDRLPVASQQYQRGYDADQAYVYVDPKKNLAVGPGTAQVVRPLNSASTLFIHDGELTWRKGQINVESLTVDISQLNYRRGLDDGAYQVGYLLGEVKPEDTSIVPGYALVSVEDSYLGNAALSFQASSASQFFNDFYAISEPAVTKARAWRPTLNGASGTYTNGSWFALDFQAPVKPKNFEITSDLDNPSAKLAVQYSDDGIIWKRAIEVKPSGNTWNALLPGKGRHRYWRLFFWDGIVSVSGLKYTGEAYMPDRRAKGETITATPYIDGLYEEIEGDFLLLATFEVKRKIISNIQDVRRVTNTKYEPVSDWLTDFQDSSLKCMFDLVERYAQQCLAPTTADFHYYGELSDDSCVGSGQFLLDPDSAFLIDLPYLVEIECRQRASVNSCSIAPSQIILLKEPELDSELSNKLYADNTLRDWSIDNGVYD